MLSTLIARLFGRHIAPASRSQRRTLRRGQRLPSMVFEPLEARLLLSASLFGVPNWVDQGPGPENMGSAVAAPNNAVNGAVEVLLMHPTVANMAFAGTVAGGVWRTADITGGGNAANIDWQPLTDKLPSLYVGALASDASNPNTLYVGTGSYSNTFRNQLGEMAVGLYRSTNANAPADAVAWENLGGATFAGVSIRRIALSPTDAQLLLVAADNGGGVGGLFRSPDGGANWNELSGAGVLGFGGGASDVVRDPNRNGTFYAAAPGAGVFRSDDSGANWLRIDNLNTAITSIAGSNIELALHDAGATSVLYAGVVTSGGALSGVFRYAEDGLDNGGLTGVDDAAETTWAAVGVAPAIHVGNQGFNNFSIAADPVNPAFVYIGGDRPPDIFRGDAGANTWTDIGAALLGTRPHADSRGLVFINNTTLVETDDGGIFRLTNPAAPGGADDWVSLNANLRAIEFHSVTYDTADNLIVGGSQDNGSAVQTATGSLTWNMFQGGDGSTQAYSVPGDVRYALGNNFGGTFSRNGAPLELQPVGGGVNLTGLEDTSGGGGAGSGSDFQFASNPGFQSRLPVEANLFNANDMMFGRRALYESTDQGVEINPVINPTDFGKPSTERFNSLVYGGMRGGTNFANVFWAGTEGGRIYLRSDSGGIFDRTADLSAAIAGTAAIHDIAIDPADYRIAYALKGDAVAMTTDGGDNWTAITDNLGSLTTELRSIALVDDTPATAGDGTVVVGALGGVMRRLPQPGGGTQTWSEFGIMPNSLVQDLDFVPVDTDGNAADGTGILLAGSFGRGAWTISDVSANIDTIGVLEIFGDENGFAEDNVIRLVREASFSNLLDIYIDSTTPVLTVELSVISQINVFGLGGNDTLTVDSSFGLINVMNGIRFDGGAGSDLLQLLQTGGAQHIGDTYSVGPANGQGLSTIVGAGTAGTQTVQFENLEPVLDLVPAATLTVNATAGHNAINYAGGGATGVVSIDAFEAIEFGNKVALVINALAGSDAIGINNAATPTGLTSISVNGGDPGVGDSLSVTSTGAAVSVNTGLATIAGATGAGGTVGVNYSGIEALALGGAIGTLTFTTTGADDALNVTPGASGAANSGTLVASGVVPSISFSNNGAITANLGGGNDTATVNGSANADVFAVSSGSVVITGRNAVNLTGTESVIVNGGAGSDTFNVTPAASVVFFIDGGDPVGTLPGDLLAINAGAQTVTYNAGPQTDEGSFNVGGNAAISFDHIESFAINGIGPAVINGTNGPDTITVIARDASTHGGTDGIQDFTVSVNSGPELLFINVDTLTVNALSGSDEVSLTTPAPNGAIWAVNVTINGGEPAAVGDRLVVRTPGAAGAENVAYTPNAADGGTLNLISLTSPVVINQIETLVYDGQNDGDTLTVLGGGGADVIVHSPGATDQAGTLAVNTLLALSYQNMGALASVRADGQGGADTLVLNGTALNDSLSVETGALVGLNARLKVQALNIETLTLEGLAGDDVFTLVPEMALSPFAVINFNGGAQASAAGDRMVLVGGAGNDAFQITGQSVMLGTKVVNGSGVERTSLDAKGGANSITYTGVLGTSEAITFASSGVAGGGQLSVPGVTQVDFSNVQTLEAVGNVPGSTETDTLAFSGTNAVDVFIINMAALGTPSDPFLKLLPATGTSPLLTLKNYSNFETLRINGLDSADTFNAYTSDAGIDRAILIDGGSPTAKRKSTDNLNVFYTPSRPRIIHSAATQNPGSGLVDLAYTNRRFLVQYADMEQIVIAKGVKP